MSFILLSLRHLDYQKANLITTSRLWNAIPFRLQNKPFSVCLSKVSDFTWSHDGTQALISYRDGFVLVGSVSGQRHWSSEINLESQITCGIWTPDDQQVMALACESVIYLLWWLRRMKGTGERELQKPLKESQRKGAI
jgi:hypothetical protein